MAIKLEYMSCLFEEAYDAAVENYLTVNEQIKEQEIAKKEYEEEQKDKEEPEDGEQSPEREKEWETFEYAPFKTMKIQFVVCLNTMGQDREFTADEVKFALQTVKQYRDIWESREKENLKKDVLFKLTNSDFDKLYKYHYEAQDQQEIEKIIEESVIAENASKNDQGEDEMNDEEKNALARQIRFKEFTKGFYAPDSAKEYALKQAKKPDELPVPKEEEKPAEEARAASGLGSQKEGS